jgi:hypothetical protein
MLGATRSTLSEGWGAKSRCARQTINMQDHLQGAASQLSRLSAEAIFLLEASVSRWPSVIVRLSCMYLPLLMRRQQVLARETNVEDHPWCDWHHMATIPGCQLPPHDMRTTLR